MSDSRFEGEIWEHHGAAGWHFVTLPHDVSDDIDVRTAPRRSAFGSVRVEVTVGATTWRTSVFPDTRAQAYVLPVRRAVRLAECLSSGDAVTVTLRLVDAD